VLNLMLHPTPNSLMFWDMVVMFGYLTLNVLISHTTFTAEKKGVAPPAWVKPLIYLSIPWAVSIHTVTAFLYSGLAARPFWMTAILAPRFLASAFASGPSLLILACLILRRVSKFDAGEKPIHKLGEIVAYAMTVNVFFVLLEFFTAFYSSIPEHIEHFEYQFLGLHGHSVLVPWMWTSATLAVVALVLLLVPHYRRQQKLLALACVAVVGSLWIDKGLGMVVTGFVPSPLGKITEYWPTVPEALITLGVYSIGVGVLSVLYKIAVVVREKEAEEEASETAGAHQGEAVRAEAA
jgi:molybdopterin-containing oxidoreductase family membrane subunit